MTPEPGPAGEPTGRLTAAGWVLDEDTTETLVELPGVRVEGRTRVYQDEALREAFATAGAPDQIWRFVFVTRLAFEPSLPAGLTTAIKSRIVAAATGRFESDLDGRGFEDIRQGTNQQFRHPAATATLTPFQASYPLADLPDIEVGGYLAVWEDEGFRLAGGAYPRLETAPIEPDSEKEGFRSELFDLIRAVR